MVGSKWWSLHNTRCPLTAALIGTPRGVIPVVVLIVVLSSSLPLALPSSMPLSLPSLLLFVPVLVPVVVVIPAQMSSSSLLCLWLPSSTVSWADYLRVAELQCRRLWLLLASLPTIAWGN